MPQVAEDEALAEFIQQVHAELEEAAAIPDEDHEEQARQNQERHRRMRERRTTYERQSRELRGRMEALDCTSDTPACVQAPRTRPRRRGAGRPRAQATRSSVRSGDSGDESGESKPPSRRLCAFCGRDIPADRSPRAIYCCDRHADRDRQRRKRQRDRDVRPRTPKTADFTRMLEISEEVAEKLREFSVCRCNGSHLELEPGECFRCGHWLPREIVGGALLVDAFYDRLAEEERERRERAVAQ